MKLERGNGGERGRRLNGERLQKNCDMEGVGLQIPGLGRLKQDRGYLTLSWKLYACSHSQERWASGEFLTVLLKGNFMGAIRTKFIAVWQCLCHF